LFAAKFQYKQSIEEDSVTVEILKGTFRFVTGLIAKKKPEAMNVDTAVATIGIRGTNVIGKADATSATIILVESEDTSRKSAIEVSNSFGTVTIDEPGYGTEIPDQYSPPSPPRRMRLQTINNLMRSMQSIQRIMVAEVASAFPITLVPRIPIVATAVSTFIASGFFLAISPVTNLNVPISISTVTESSSVFCLY